METKKFKVLRSMTEKEIKNLGGNMWVRKHASLLLGLAVVAVVLMLLVQYNLKSAFTGVLEIIPVIAVFIYFLMNYDKAGKALWEEVKDKPQPIEL